MRSVAAMIMGAVLCAAAGATAGCGASSYHDRCHNNSGMPQGDLPCHEPAANSPQRDKDEPKHQPPGNPMPAR
ncbi:MAG: hypothetical protein ACOC1F_12470 [Myxococcota bacterium]